MSVLVAVALFTNPALSFLGGYLGQRLDRRGAVELDRWRRREEAMLTMRWATELATDRDPHRAKAGAAVLSAMVDAALVDDDDLSFVAAITLSVMHDRDPRR